MRLPSTTGNFPVRTLAFNLFFLLAGALAGCGSSGNTDNTLLTPARVATIGQGVKTKEQVRALLGAPQSSKTQLAISQPAGAPPLPAKYAASEIWAFWTSSKKQSLFTLPFTSPAAANDAKYLVLVYFDERGIVVDCQAEGPPPGKD
jgi:hypothetical protein